MFFPFISSEDSSKLSANSHIPIIIISFSWTDYISHQRNHWEYIQGCVIKAHPVAKLHNQKNTKENYKNKLHHTGLTNLGKI